jgi:hypothetical protein
MRLADAPAAQLGRRLPPAVRTRIAQATERGLAAAARAALWSLPADRPVHPWTEFWHKTAVAVSGAAAGFIGLEALLVEIPLSTTLMLRSIADIARAQGESPAHPETALNIVEVLALGDVQVLQYLALRRAWAADLRAAATVLSGAAAADAGAPAVARVLSRVAARYQLQVGELAAAEIVPVLGAVSGAALNWMFLEHFQAKAYGHFTVRRLERTYGGEVVQRRLAEAAQRRR